jgi:hypothetical protein
MYPNPMGHTLKSFTSIKYESGIISKREGDSESGLAKSQNGSIISQLVPVGSETLPVICRKVSDEIRSNRSIYGKSRRVRKVMEGSEKNRDDPGCLRKSRGFHNRCIQVALRGNEFPLKSDSDLVKEVDF